MRRIEDLKDAQIILNELLNWKAQMESRIFDLRGRRIANLGSAVENSDAVTLEQVKEMIAKIK